MSFLEAWTKALNEAVRDGQPGRVWKYERKSASFRVVARTRHPAFMGAAPVKHDPERDKQPSSIQFIQDLNEHMASVQAEFARMLRVEIDQEHDNG